MRIENRFHPKDAIAWPFCEIATALSVVVGTGYFKNGQAGLLGRAPPIVASPNQTARGGARCLSHAQEDGSIDSVWLLLDAYLIANDGSTGITAPIVRASIAGEWI